MKYLGGIFGAILMILVIAAMCQAAPFLVCDPYPVDQQITNFTGTIDGQNFSTPYSLHSSGQAIVYDINSLSDGVHQFTELKAVNIRGESTPVNFTVPAKASALSGMGFAP